MLARPFPLTTLEEIQDFAGVVRASIVDGTMPPWQPSDDCNTYVANIDLTPDETEVLLAWLDWKDTGKPADAPADSSSVDNGL